MNSKKIAIAILKELIVEVKTNDSLRRRLANILKENKTQKKDGKIGSFKRRPGQFNPFHVYRDSPEKLEMMLKTLEMDQLKDIISEHGLDRTKLAMKWQDKERLIEKISSTVKLRYEKGDVFRNPPSSSSQSD